MPTTCLHGYPPGECLICRTLPAQAGAPAGPPARPPAGTTNPPESRRHSIGLQLTGVIVGIVVIGLIAWTVAGVVFALFHILELIVVGAAAAWVGYRIGHYRGSRRPR